MSLLKRRKKQKKIRKWQPASLEEAVELVLSSATNVEYQVGELEVHGSEGRCAVGDRQYYADVQRAIGVQGWLYSIYGDQYSYAFTVYGDRPKVSLSQALAPGWRPYAQESQRVSKHHLSLEELSQWLDSAEARATRVSAWWVSMTAQ